METGRVLVIAGVAAALVGATLWLGSRLGLGRLPGDVVVERENFTLAIPIVTSIIASLVLTVTLNIVLRLK
jgi:hypothetical protein